MTKIRTTTKTKKEGLVTSVLDLEGKVVEKIDLPKVIFAAKVNGKLLAQAVRVYLGSQRQGTVSTKTRGEIIGSTRKIYRQKGTGRARHGDRKAPIFVGGGIVFGPKPRDFSLKLPKKMKTNALFSALTSKFQNNGVLVVGGLEKIKAKTQEMIKILANLKIEIADSKLRSKVLLVLPKVEKNVILACRNVQNLTLVPVNLLNPYLVLVHQKIIFTKEAMNSLRSFFPSEMSSLRSLSPSEIKILMEEAGGEPGTLLTKLWKKTKS